MAFEVRLLELAERDIDEICQYLSQFYPGTPGRFLDAMEKDFEKISLNPKMFPEYEHNRKYRKMVTNDFLTFYKIDEENKRYNTAGQSTISPSLPILTVEIT